MQVFDGLAAMVAAIREAGYGQLTSSTDPISSLLSDTRARSLCLSRSLSLQHKCEYANGCGGCRGGGWLEE